MMTLEQYFDEMMAQGIEAWETAQEELAELVRQDEEAWVEGEQSELVTEWAEAHEVDLTAGREVLGEFTTYFQTWLWDYLED